jgi:hypothetical protein
MFRLIIFISLISFNASASKALRYAKTSCENKKNPNMRACWLYARLLAYNGRINESNRYYQKACKMGEKLACETVSKGLPKQVYKKKSKPKPKPKVVAKPKPVEVVKETPPEPIETKKEKVKEEAKEVIMDLSTMMPDIMDTVPAVDIPRIEEPQVDIEPPPPPPDCYKKLMHRIVNCKAYECSAPDENNTDIIISHKVTKIAKKVCRYEQERSDGKTMKCRLTRSDLYSLPPWPERETLELIMGQWIDYGICKVST